MAPAGGDKMLAMSRLSIPTIVLGVLCLGLLGIATNVATAALPSTWGPYLWLAWPLLLALLGLTAWLEVRRSRQGQPQRGESPQARGVLIDRVQRYWVHGVLEQSLYQQARIELGLSLTVDAPHPWRAVLAPPGAPARAVAPGTAMSAVFDELDKTMLILGAPGAGKTTMLLELVRDLLQRARRDGMHPIPVVLTLSSWATRREPLADWIVRELATRYEIAPAHAQTWLHSDLLVPMLDGLDEVAREHQEACVNAINAFRTAYGTTRVVVCCRSEDYQRLSRSLQAYGTLTIEPLSRTQVAAFLDTAGAPLAAVRAALRADPPLWELAESPLNLSIMVLAYRDTPVGAVQTGGTGTQRRERLFTAYVHTMLRRRPSDTYRPRQTVRRLAWLARQLSANDQTVFTFDQLDEYSVPVGSREVGFVAGTAVGVLGTVLLGVAGLLAFGWPGLVAGALLATVVGAGLGADWFERIGVFDLSYRQRKQRSGQSRLPGVGDWLEGAIFGESSASQRSLAVAVGAAAAALIGWGDGWWAVAASVASGVAAAVGTVNLCTGLSWPISDLTPTDTARELPSPGAVTVLRGGLLASVVVAVLTGLQAALLVAWPLDLAAGQLWGLFVALCAAFVTLVWLGGYALIEQVVVRSQLRHLGLLPLPGRPFLHYATQCLFLRRVGDGYLFGHLSLQGYFAELWPNRYVLKDTVDATLPDL